MTSRFKVGCSGSGDLITSEELFEILIMILPEAETIKNTFIKWVSLPEDMKQSMKSRLELLAATRSLSPSSKEITLHKGYSMSRILLKVFNEWSYIQDTFGAPGIQPGFTALPKRLETDLAMMMKCMQDVLENIIRQKIESTKNYLAGQPKSAVVTDTERIQRAVVDREIRKLYKPLGRSISDTVVALSAGDHISTARRENPVKSPDMSMIPGNNLDSNKNELDNNNEDELSDSGAEMTFDTDEDAFEQFANEEVLAKYLLNIGGEHLINDSIAQFSTSEESQNSDDESSD